MPTVNVASPLRSYTQGAQRLAAEGATVAQVLADLERRFPGMRFRMIDEQGRIRQHIRIFVNTTGVEDLSAPVAARDVVHLICALSGG
jgi:molybdopterin converting factor small subunit